MAEHLNQPAPGPELNPFSNMGKPVPPDARQKGYDECRNMGLDQADAWAATNAVAEQLERDKPYEAQKASMQYLDLSSTYRLMAAILCAIPAGQPEAEA